MVKQLCRDIADGKVNIELIFTAGYYRLAAESNLNGRIFPNQYYETSAS